MTEHLPDLPDIHGVRLYSACISHRNPQHDINLLSADERERAARYKFAAARMQFVAARAFLRETLAAQAETSPDKLRFAYGERGKPSLAGSTLRFNLAHAGDLILLGVTHGREIGVDVEQHRPLPHLRRMAEDNFSVYEREVLFALPEEERLGAFYRIWTRKEAYIKAVGDGFALPLADFDVTHDEPARLLRAGAQWALHHLAVAPDYTGAVCVAASAM